MTVAPHVFQLLRGMTLHRRKAPGKAVEEEEEEESGDCDDEDECGRGSGDGELRVRNQLRFLAGDGDGGAAAAAPLWVVGFGDGVGSCSSGSAQVPSLQAPSEAADAQNSAGWMRCQSRQQLRRDPTAFPGWLSRGVLRAAHWRGFEASCKSGVGPQAPPSLLPTAACNPEI